MADVLTYRAWDGNPADYCNEFDLDSCAPEAEDYDDPQELLDAALDWAVSEADNCGYEPSDRVWVTVDGPNGIEIVRGSREVAS